MQDFKKYLDPIYKKLDSLNSLYPEDTTIHFETEEYSYHQLTVDRLVIDAKSAIHHMDDLTEQIEHYVWIVENETGDDKTDAIKEYNRLLTKMEDLVERINWTLQILDESYFGKIIFSRNSSEHFPSKIIPVYIGKFAYFDKVTNTPLISDWRAPISNLYYQYSGPIDDVSFTSPAGVQQGDITQKRQFEIGSGRINEIYDIQSGNTTTDQFLLKQLDKRDGKKLKEIVSTIQSQQNEIIRDKVDVPMLIQGVAGSGKTTIILHRLAYLFYTFPEKIRPENSLIIAPNQMFIDYIADVLPSLGVKGLSQNTFLLWGREKLKLDNKFVLHNEEDLETKKYKGSLQFYKLIERFIEYYEDNFFENMPSLISQTIQEEYQILKEKSPTLSMREQVNLAVEAVFVQRRISNKGREIKASRMNMEQKRTEDVKKYIRDKLRPYEIYKLLYKLPNFEILEFSKSEWSQIRTKSLKGFSKDKGFKGYSESDLAAMLMINRFIDGSNEDLYDYVVVDEAQDLSPIEIQSILKYAKRGNLTLAGDTAQAIVPPYYITDWIDLKKSIEEEIGQELIYHELTRSYRSTIEIIEFANSVLKGSFPKTYQLPEAVLRHGEDVNIIKTDDEKYKEVIETIRSEELSQRSSIALITRDELSSDNLEQSLVVENFKNQIYTYRDENFHSGIQILPVKYAKGLEFDCVILVDVNNTNYTNDDEARLLYVGMTRALHKLYVHIPEKNESPLIPSDLITTKK